MLQIAFSFMPVPGKGPIKIAPIENGSVIAAGRLLGPSPQAVRASCELEEPPCVNTDALSSAKTSGKGLLQHLARKEPRPDTLRGLCAVVGMVHKAETQG